LRSIIKATAVFLLPTFALAQQPIIRKEHWGMTKAEVIQAEKAAPLKRLPNQLTYRGTQDGIHAQVLFVFTNGKLDQISFVEEDTKDPEVALLTWCLALTKRYGHGVVYYNAKPIGDAAVVLDVAFKDCLKQKAGEVLAVFPPAGSTYTGVGVKIVNGNPSVEMDFTNKPNQ
jgi:hypothetical protein